MSCNISGWTAVAALASTSAVLAQVERPSVEASVAVAAGLQRPVEQEMRSLIGAGVLDRKRLLTFLPVGDALGARAQRALLGLPAPRILTSGSGAAGGAPGFFEFGQSPPAMTDDFESYTPRDLSIGMPTAFSPLGEVNGAIAGQPAPAGAFWASQGFSPNPSDPETVVVVNASDPGFSPDGPATDGSGSAIGQMLANLRTLSPTITSADSSVSLTDDDLWIPTDSLALVATFDYYFASRVETLLWVDFASAREGLVSARYFAGGFPALAGMPVGGSGGAFGSNHPIILGHPVGGANGPLGDFYVSPFRVRPDQWTTVALRISPGGQSVFQRSPDTTSPFVGVAIMDRAGAAPLPGFESGWAEIYPGKPGDCLSGGCVGPDGLPGTADDIPYPADGSPLAPGVYSGVGVARALTGDPAPQTGEDQQAPRLAALSHDTFAFHRFNDPDIQALPTFTRSDVYVDNLTITGTRFALPAASADLRIPFHDDMERWTTGPLGPATNGAYIAALTSPARIIEGFTPPPGGGTAKYNSPEQAIEQVNEAFAADDEYGFSFGTGFLEAVADSLGPDGLKNTGDETPATLAVNIRLSDAKNVRGVHTAGGAVRILLGAVNPATGESDNRVYVRQPNTGQAGTVFNFQAPADRFRPSDPESIVPPHWRSALLKQANPVFNDDFWNFEALPQDGGPGSFAIPTGRYFEARIEILDDSPRPLLPFQGAPLVPFRLFVDHVELCPPDPLSGLGDCVNSSWVALSDRFSGVALFSGHSSAGVGQTMQVDDISATGAARAFGNLPSFRLPYFDGFESYRPDPRSIDGQGNLRVREIAAPDGDLSLALDFISVRPVCQYQITQYLTSTPMVAYNEGALPVGSIVSVDFSTLAPPEDPALAGICPGIATAPGGLFRFYGVVSGGLVEGRAVASAGRMRLLTERPVSPSISPSISGLRYVATPPPRWRAGVADSAWPAPPAGDPAPDSRQALRIVATSGARDENDVGMTNRALTRTPFAPSPQRPDWVSDLGRATMDVFVETQVNPDDPLGASFPAPLQRFSVQALGSTGAGDRSQAALISEIRLGGPDFNRFTLVPADEIALFFRNPDFPAPPGQPTVPEFLFESTGVKVPMGRWFRLGLEVNRSSGAVRWLFDPTPGEDIFSEGSDAITLDSPRNPGVAVAPGALRLGAIRIRLGDDEGGDGRRIPPKTFVQGARNDDPANRPGDLSLLPLPVDATGAPLADPWNGPRPVGSSTGPGDWCVYEVERFEQSPWSSPRQRPLVQDVDEATGAMRSVRPLQSGDLLAVARRDPDRAFAAGAAFGDFRFVSRRVADSDIVDAPGPAFGAPLASPCPGDEARSNPDDGFIFLDASGNEMDRGEWRLLGQPGDPGVNLGFPNGGIRSDAPPYNGGPGEALPDGGAGDANSGFRSILLAQFYLIPDPGAAIQPQRWFVDNLAVSDDCQTIGPDNLLALLANFETFGGDGLLDLLNSFGKRHPSCP